MRKAIVIFTVLALISMSFATIGTYVNKIYNPDDSQDKENSNVIKMEITFSNPQIKDEEKYLIINLEGCSPLLSPGKPVIPVYKKVFTLPFGTQIESVEVIAGNIEEKSLPTKIIPAYELVPPDMHSSLSPLKENKAIYESNSIFPETRYEYATMGGISDGKHVTFLSLNLYPLHYIPSKNVITIAHNIDVEIKYNPPEKPLIQNDVYDLIIISPSEFSDALQPLVNHKENHGIKTKLVTLNEIYGSVYFPSQGRDD
ncbi:MAG: hypothetical protein FE048_03070, partial [Thermoplasmata archaeon]